VTRLRLNPAGFTASHAASNSNKTANTLETYGEMILLRKVVVGGVSVDTSSFDFNDHTSRVASVETSNIVLIVLVGCFVGLRLIVRSLLLRRIFLDDSRWRLICIAFSS
jgi:hypothetical protein